MGDNKWDVGQKEKKEKKKNPTLEMLGREGVF